MKNKISNFAKGVVLSVALIVASSCNLEDHLVNPSALSPDQASNDYIFNAVQLSFGGFFLTATQFGMDNTRMLAMFGGTYENAYSANTFNGMWQNAYSDLMVNANLLLSKTVEDPATTEIEYNPYFQGTTKVLKAYVLMTLVDYFGDVPYSQAFNTTEFNPGVDAGADVYAAAKTLLDEAVVDLNAVTGSTTKATQDLYYAGNTVRWRKLANTLLMKWHLQRRLIDAAGSQAAIATLIAGNDMISSAAEDFVFSAPANSVSAPNTYHPWFYNNYLTSAGQYMSNSYMKELYDAKGIKDPRIRYYFYRQVNAETTDVNELSCSIPTFPYVGFPPLHYPPGTAYCQLPEGYWGRDHLNNEGTPPDGLKRTTYGVYPAGGRFDANDAAPVSDQGLSSGARGKGILPIMMHSFRLFMEAEYQLALVGSAPAARALLDQAVRASISKVTSFNSSVVNPGFVPSATGINNYVNAVLANYDLGTPIPPNATVAQNQLDVLVKEYWIALWGNGVEAYNTVRRTGKPANLQPGLAANPGKFYRSFTYPAVYVIRNNKAVQKANNEVKVFWDNNPDGFVK